MGILFAKLWQRLFHNEEYKICIVGLDNAGKTTTLYKLHLGEVVSTKPTIGSNVEEIVHNNVRLQAWDLGGQESLRSSWATYFVNTNAVVMVVDSTDRERMHIIKNELFRILELPSLRNAVILVFANKQDIPNCLSAAQISETLNLHAIKDHNWHIQACCALTGEGLYEGIDWITQQVKRPQRS